MLQLDASVGAALHSLSFLFTWQSSPHTYCSQLSESSAVLNIQEVKENHVFERGAVFYACLREWCKSVDEL